MLRAAARAGLGLWLLGSVALTAVALRDIAADPAARPFVEAGAARIAATTDRMIAARATPDHLAALIDARLAEAPRNWLAIAAIEGVAAEQGVALPPDLVARRQAAWDAHTGLWTRLGDCAACAADPAACSLSAELFCQAPMVLTPLGDVAGLARAGWDAATGVPVDRLDLTLSAVGLGATVAIVATGGTSYSMKLGAGILRSARRMRLMSPGLTRIVTRAAEDGLDWAALPLVRSSDDLARLIRPGALAPLSDVAIQVERLGQALPLPETLHLLRHVDDAADARRLADAAAALGPRTVGRVEVLGKSRVLRATLRASDDLIGLGAGLAGVIAGLGAAAASLGQSVAARLARRALR